jgi:ATP-dependent RNA helicase DeaD
VAARGIDLPNIGLVIHAELPQNAQTLQHRSGRTGRAGRKGVSVLLVPMSRRRKAELLLQSGNVQAVWGGAPSADDIRKLDQERLLLHPFVTEDLTEDDLAMAKALLAERSPEDIAAALVRMYRSHLPAAEEVFDPGAGSPASGPREYREPREDQPRPRGGDRNGMPDSTWFRLNVGRQKNADPRWLIPMICRQGKITKQEIGAIRIFEHETKFEIASGAAERFQSSVSRIERSDVRIEPLAKPHDSAPHEQQRPAARPPHRPDRPVEGKKPWKPKPKHQQS